MDLTEAIYGRRAVRAYAAEAVPREVLQRMIEDAVQAPSAMNEQPWAFAVVTDRALLARVSFAAKSHLLATEAFGPRLTRLRDMLNDPDYEIFYHAPALILIAAAEEGPFAVADCALAAQNLMLAAHGAGLGSCWIGLAQPWLATAEGKAALGLSSRHVPVAPIIVGRPQAAPPAVPRKAPEIHWLT